jgi:uncharacterized membrane protein YbhN (UPF0104 family)
VTALLILGYVAMAVLTTAILIRADDGDMDDFIATLMGAVWPCVILSCVVAVPFYVVFVAGRWLARRLP